MNYIIGSGLSGLLAKLILGDGWKFIPQKRSRYYTFEPVLADNFIVRDESVDEVIKSFSPVAGVSNLIYYKRAFSMAGELLYKENELTIEPYLRKIYGEHVPTHAPKLLKTTFWVYNFTTKALHDGLLELNKDEISSAPDEVLKIDLTERKMVVRKTDGTDRRVLDYDQILSTVPLNVLYGWCGISEELSAQPICYYNIRTRKVDLEKADQVLVCDDSIEFFKVTKTNKLNEYVFWTFDKVENPHGYFGLFLDFNLDLLDAFRVENALPIGNPPDLTGLESVGIYCVGSNAQWDDFMDASSSIKRLLRLSDALNK